MLVQEQVHVSSSNSGELAHHNILGNALEDLLFGVDGRIHKHIDRFFEGTTEERSGLNAIDTVAIDGHEMTMHGHDIDEAGQMPVVDVRTIETNDVAKLAEDRSSHSFNTKDLEDLNDVVTDRAGCIDIIHTEDGHEVGTIGLEDPLIPDAEASIVIPNGNLGPATHEDLLDVLNASEFERSEHALLETLEEFIVLLAGLNLVFLHKRNGVAFVIDGSRLPWACR